MFTFFKNFIRIMKEEGNEVLVTAREKEMTIYLLDKYNIKYTKISSIGNSKLELLKELFVRNYQVFTRLTKKFKPDNSIWIDGITIAPVGRLLRVPSLVFYDTVKCKADKQNSLFFLQ